MNHIRNSKECRCKECTEDAYAEISEAQYLDMMARNERSAMTEW